MDLPDHSSLLSQPTRARLFEVLKGLRRSASTDELAGELGLHINGVCRQLERMHEGGLVERRRITRGRGRPRDEWSIASGTSPTGRRPEAYSDLAGWLARAMSTGPGVLRQVESTGRSIGRELAPAETEDLPESVRQVFSALGFQPEVQLTDSGRITCGLHNCPYRRSVRENPDVICTLHRGITQGLLDVLDPSAHVTRFEPHDPDRGGCVVEISGSGRAGTEDASR